MRILLSPAKTLREVPFPLPSSLSSPAPLFFPEESRFLEELFYKKKEEEVRKIWNISPELARRTKQRYDAAFENRHRAAALALYFGAVYKSCAPETLPASALLYLEKNLRIISALYGMLRPSSSILPYRLEMSNKIAFRYEGSDFAELPRFWGPRLAAALCDDLREEAPEDRFLLNLASKEYARAVCDGLAAAPVACPVYEVLFLIERRNKKGGVDRKNIATYAKQERGRMLRTLCLNEVRTLDEVKSYRQNGFVFDAGASSERQLVFVRSEL